ncbi:hypothetical protein [Cupriavidus necator]
MWEFFALAGTVYERTTEEEWEVSGIFDEACRDLVKVSIQAGVEPAVFATKLSRCSTPINTKSIVH